MNREEAHKHKKRKSGKTMLFAGLFIAVCVSVLIAFLFALGGADFAGIFGNRNYWLTVGVVNGLLLVAFLLMYRIDAQNVALGENDLEDTEWLTTKRLKKLKEFTVTTWEKMPEHGDEIVIGAEKKGKELEIISTSALHALIVGTTGSGKTTGFVDQNIAILGRSKGKPSMIIADPKKELYEKHAKQLESEGYTISTLDLREPYSSARWNPMQVLIRRIRQVRELQNDMKQDGNKYYACGEVFLSHSDARTRVQELKDEIFENAMDLVYTLCPVQNKDQPTWEEGARNLIFGLVLAFCEDCIAGKMDEKQLQLFNVYHNITKYCSEDTTALKKYLLEGREEFSKVRGLVKIPVGRQGRIFKGAGACQYGTHYERQDIDIVFVGSQQLYAAACGRRYSFDDERERHRHRKHGRKSERIVCHRSGRTVYAPQVCNTVLNADL